MMDINKEKLRIRLKQPLPGISAQKVMMPKLDDPSRFAQYRKATARPGGVLILLYPHMGEMHIPLMLRPEYPGAHGGQISLPGGKKEEFDNSLVETALRESEEELGIPNEEVDVIGNLSELFIIASNFNVLPVIGSMDQRPDFKADDREVVEIIETPISMLLRSDAIRIKSFRVDGGLEIDAPYFDIYGHHVWGATAMILNEFLEVYKDL